MEIISLSQSCLLYTSRLSSFQFEDCSVWMYHTAGVEVRKTAAMKQDVYKRQVYPISTAVSKIVFRKVSLMSGASLRALAVSYTHLDVYKRQGWGTASGQRGSDDR